MWYPFARTVWKIIIIVMDVENQMSCNDLFRKFVEVIQSENKKIKEEISENIKTETNKILLKR